MKRPRLPDDPDSPNAAYARALRWLTARELSEGQVRMRLEEKGFSAAAIAPALERLLHDGTINDRRTAAAVARTEARVRRHGPHRVMAKLIAMQIDRDLAKEVIRDLFGEEDQDTLIDKALERRLRGHVERLNDPRERQKLIAYLIRQGFPTSAASAAIRRTSKR